MPMGMNLKVRSESQGSSHTLKILIICIGEGNEKYSEEIKLDELVAVKFNFIQNSDYGSDMRALICVRKILKDCNVKAKVWTDTGYSSEKICSEKICWESIEERMWNLLRTEYYTDRTTSVFLYIFEFNVSMYVYKVEKTVNEKLYNDTEFTDFSLSTAEGSGSVAIHRAHLAAHSDVFRAMLSREWKETKEGRLNMEGITLQTLQQLKDYMYLGTLPDDDFLPLWSIASCYLMEDLKTKCLLKLSEIIKAENFYSMLEYSIENKMSELTFAIIRATPEKVLRDAEHISKGEDVIEKIVRDY